MGWSLPQSGAVITKWTTSLQNEGGITKWWSYCKVGQCKTQ